MKKKGQAALEFLMTYGWAILAAIIVIGVLVIYFRPSTLTSNSAVVTAPFYAVGASVEPSQILVEVRNNGGESITTYNTTTALSFTTPSGAACDSVTGTGALSAGATQVINFSSCGGFVSGDTVSADITISYSRPNSQLNLTSTGSVSGSA